MSCMGQACVCHTEFAQYKHKSCSICMSNCSYLAFLPFPPFQPLAAGWLLCDPRLLGQPGQGTGHERSVWIYQWYSMILIEIKSRCFLSIFFPVLIAPLLPCRYHGRGMSWWKAELWRWAQWFSIASVFPISVNTHFLIHVSFNRRLLETHYLLLGVFGKHWEVKFGAFLTCKNHSFDSMM